MHVLGREPRGRGIVFPGARDDVPEVGQLGEALDDLPPVLVGDEARLAEELLDDDAHRDRALSPGRLPGDLEELAQQPGPVLQAASVLVVAPVSGREQVEGDGGELSAHVDDVDAGAPRAPDRRTPPVVDVAEVGLVERAGLQRIPFEHRSRHRTGGHFTAEPVGVEATGIGHLDAEEGAVLVHFVAGARENRDVVVVPQGEHHFREHLRARVDAAMLGVDDRPAPFRLDSPHPGVAARSQAAHAVAVARLVEAVPGDLRTDADRLEQNVVARISGHGSLPGARC